MTFDELKDEANRHGYDLIKKRQYERLKPCVCGCNRRTMWGLFKGGIALECIKCGKTVEGKNRTDAVRNWNKVIEGEAENDGT